MFTLRKKDKWRIVIIICILAIATIAGAILIANQNRDDNRIDLLVKPDEIKGHGSAFSTDGYMHLIAEKTQYNADDTITLTFHTAYYDTLEEAKKAYYVCTRIVHCDYLEVVAVDASEKILHDRNPIGDSPLHNDVYAVYEFVDYDPADLVYQPQGLFKTISKESLPYTVTVTIKIKEDAPERIQDEIWITTYSDILKAIDYTGSPIMEGIGTSSRVCIKFVREGDVVTIEAHTDYPR